MLHLYIYLKATDMLNQIQGSCNKTFFLQNQIAILVI